MTIFRAYDIRGVYPKDIDAKMATKIGKAYATHTRVKSCVVGSDARLSSPKLKEALIAGLTSCGVDVFDIGMVTTPMVYFARGYLECDGAIMVTASHNPPQYNGFKMCRGEFALSPEEIQLLPKLISEGVYRKGAGELYQRDILVPYLNHLKEYVVFERKLKIVIDGGNGSAGPVAVKLFQEIGCDVIPLYAEPDGNFPNHAPDPTVANNLADLKSKVVVHNSDLGIAFDGDGDRVVFVDERGCDLYPDEALAILARDLLYREKGARVLFDVKCSMLLSDDIKKHGGVPVIWRTGHTFIKKKMVEDMIPLAGEASGHVYYYENGYDDGIFAAVRMAGVVALSTHRKFSQLRASLPKYVSTPNIVVPCPDNDKFKIIKGLVDEFKSDGYEVLTLDGVRVDFGYGWGLVRASNTEPALSMRFEAKTDKQLDTITAVFKEKLERRGIYL